MGWLLADKRLHFELHLNIALFSIGLFIVCMFCHGELARRKPGAAHLTSFYLMIAIGGALGALLVGVGAPLALPGYYELDLSVYALALLAAWLLWRELHWSARIGSVILCIYALATSLYTIEKTREDAIFMTRNFYGALRVKETGDADSGRKRSLVHGAILHGDQFLDGLARYAATTYHSLHSGVGLALTQKAEDLKRPRRVGVIGLGAGTLAAYGNRGDVFRFYEINPAVIEIARRDFTYLADTLATVEIALGDARLDLEREPPQHFDVLAIDAFSGDSIPVHLLTLEALAAYERHMQPDGIIAFHVSNRFLELHPIVDALARARGFAVAWIDEVRSDGATSSDWILLSKSNAPLTAPRIADAAQPIPPRPNWRLWTDDFNNILQALK